ncbi:MAG: imidazoleglycerol-phosphate dehydratase HisB [Oscillospiraceae bacterium]|nr:imidazoleglycerol-phosphate dehydratase HisB [Oscillospiraceae bacterium]
MRCAEVTRKTNETDISLKLCIDGGEVNVKTGIGFFDHMLTAFAVHAGFGLELTVSGDLWVDGHHTVEDTGIVLGKAFSQCIGDKKGIARYGSFYIPMDEALAFSSVDISGRPYLVYNADFYGKGTGDFEVCLCEEFFRAFAFNAGITLHMQVLYGNNDHHKAEALFKAVAHAIKEAVKVNDGEVLSTKGTLD